MSKTNSTPYTVKRVLANLELCDGELDIFDPNFKRGAGYVRHTLADIVRRGIRESINSELLAALENAHLVIQNLGGGHDAFLGKPSKGGVNVTEQIKTAIAKATP